MQIDSHVSAAQRLLTLSAQLGIQYLFTNLGSDHPAFIEAFALLAERGVASPKVIICPHEVTALSAAHGYAMITHRPQLVLVHVDVGTQNLGGSVHNASRARVPAIIVAGMSPVTTDGSRTGSRNEFIHYIQDVPRQQEIVSQYMKWSYELRAPEMIDAVLLRAMQMCSSAPQGPVYITGAREMWEGEASQPEEPKHWPAARMSGLPADDADALHRALIESRQPIVITSSLGRQPESVRRLADLATQIGLGVCEIGPQYLNFPGTHACHLGYRRNAFVEQADLILMIDVEVPWIPSKVRPAAHARVFHIDQDPLKAQYGFWHFPTERCWQADSGAALNQLLERTRGQPSAGRDARHRWLAAQRPPRVASSDTSSGPITAQELFVTLREFITERSVVLMEAPSSTEMAPTILQLDRPGSYFSSGGSSLGWGINAAIGAKLARPDAEVIAVVGDGCYIFGAPSSAYWVAKTYGVAQLTIIINNGGWNSPKRSTLGVHPTGAAQRNDTYWVTATAGARLAEIAAAAGGAAAFSVARREELQSVLQEALQIVRHGRSAVVDVTMARASSQVLS